MSWCLVHFGADEGTVAPMFGIMADLHQTADECSKRTRIYLDDKVSKHYVGGDTYYFT